MKNTELQIFNNEFGSVRTVVIDGEPWFVGKDVAEILGYSNSRKAIGDHVDDEDRSKVAIRDTIGREQIATVINESGLYSLIMSSKLPQAKKFKRWVTAEVLPSIRKNGMYTIDELLDNPDLLLSIVTQLKEEYDARRVKLY
jgi:prophage antirepressor-like protein